MIHTVSPNCSFIRNQAQKNRWSHQFIWTKV